MLSLVSNFSNCGMRPGKHYAPKTAIIRETSVDRKPQTAERFIMTFFILVGQKKWFLKSVTSPQCKIYGLSGNLWAGPAGETLPDIFSGLCNPKVSPKVKKRYQFMHQASTSHWTEWGHLWVYYQVLFKIYGNLSRRRRVSYNFSLNDDKAHLMSQRTGSAVVCDAFTRLQGSSISGVTQHNSMG